MRERVAKSIFWMVWSRGFLQAISFATTLVVARWLDPHDYGLMALAGVWTGVLGLICELGLGAAVVQFPDLTERELNLCFYLSFGTACVAYVLLFLAAPGIAAWFAAPALASVLRVVALVLPLSALAIIPDALLQKNLHLDRVTKADMASSFLALGAVFSMAWKGEGVWALVAGTITRVVFRDIILYGYLPWWPGLRIGSVRLRHIMNFSFATLGSRTLWAVYDQSDNFVLGKVTGEVALGFYTMARDLASIPVVRISSVVNQLSVPLMAQMQNDAATMRNILLRGVRLTISVSAPVCVGLALVANDFVRIALSDKWMPIVPILQILSAFCLIRSVDVLIAPVLRARYRTNFLLIYNLALLALMPLSFLVGAWLAAGVGVAIAWLVVYPVIMARMTIEALHEVDLPIRTFLAQLVGPLFSVTVMAVVVLGIMELLPGDGRGTMVARLVLETCGGAVAYATTLWFCGGPLKAELREVITWVIKPRRGVIS
jgi:O-antigen/teichoic acid export membrane protein